MKAPSLLPDAADMLQQPGLKEIVRLAEAKLLFIKISGFYRSSDNQGSAYSDLENMVKKFAEEIPNQLIWASDWPHTGNSKDRRGKETKVSEPFQKIDDMAVIKNIKEWVGDTVWQKMLVETPSKMFA